MPLKDITARNAYMQTYMAERYARRRSEVVVRLGGKCVRCGGTSDLQIDHIDPSAKAIEWAQLAGMSQVRLEREIVKSQILCRLCHEIKSGEERSWRHGTLHGYQHKRCRCVDCQAAGDALNKRRRTHRHGSLAQW